MKQSYLLTFFATFVLLGNRATSRGAETEPPDLIALTQAGEKTLERLQKDPARWSVRCVLSPAETISVLVTVEGSNRSETFLHEKNGQRTPLFNLVMKDDAWYLFEKGQHIKYRPYEATLHVPGAYFFLSLANLVCLVDPDRMSAARFVSRANGVANYRLPIGRAERRTLEQALAMFDQAKRENPGAVKPEMEEQMANTRKLVADGQPLRVDEASGMIVESRIQKMLVKITNFKWLDQVPPSVFQLPEDRWDDRATGWVEPENWLLLIYDPMATRATPGLATDGFRVNVATGEMRRLPFDGALSVPLCFLRERHEILLTGTDPIGGINLIQVDLRTGENTPIPLGSDSTRIPGAAALSPDGKMVAFLQIFGGQEALLDFQMRLLDLESHRISDLGTPGRLGGPFSWLPDGSGIILKRFLPAPKLDAIEERMICRLDRDGTLTDLFRGDSPLVLRRAQRILYENERGWYTCNFDGSDSRRYADGMKGYGAPTISPDEKHIAFMRYNAGLAPVLTVFEFGKSEGRQVTTAAGIMGFPRWQ